MAEPRIIGVKLPDSMQAAQTNLQPGGVKPQPNSQDATTKLRASTYSNTMSTLTTVVQAGNRAANNAIQIAENIAGQEAARGAISAYQKASNKGGDFGTGLAAIAQLANTAMDTFEKVDAKRKEEQARKDAAMQKENQALAFEEVERMTTDAYTQLREDGGYNSYRNKVDDYLRQVKPFLDPDAYMQLTTKLLAPVADVQKEYAQTRADELKKVQEANRATEVAKAQIEFSSLNARIANAATPEESAALMQEWNTKFSERIAGLAPMDAAVVARGLLEEVRGSYNTNLAQFAELSTTLSNYESYAYEMQGAIEQYNQDNDLTAYQIRENQLRTRYGVAASGALADPLAAQRHIQERMQLQDDIENGRKQRVLSNAEAMQFTRDETTSLALTLYQDPSQLALYKRQFGNNPFVTQAAELAESMRTYDQASVDYQRKANQTQLEIQQLNVQNAQNLASWLQSDGGSESMQSMVKNDGVRALLNAESQRLLAAMEGGQKEVDPAQMQALRQDVINNRAEIATILQDGLDVEYRQLQLKAQPLQQYGLDNKEEREKMAAGAAARSQGLINRVQTQGAEVHRNYGHTPNFELPQLDKATVGGVEVMLPFKPGAYDGGPIENNYSEYRQYYNGGQGGNHAGVDISVASGTGIFFYTQGEVVRVANDPTGYGNYVDIKSPDGKYHRFAHLNHVYVSVGQSVAPGQHIANSGSTGRSTGPHLHWEVRTADDYGSASSMDPVEYMAGLKKSPPRMIRGAGNTTSQNYTSPPVPATRPTARRPYIPGVASSFKGDYKPNTGEANFGYAPIARDRAFRIKLHQISSKLGIPAQWLADLMAFETGGTFDPGIPQGGGREHGGNGAVGLIQFMPDTARGLGTSVDALAGMSRVQQLDWVYKYLEPMKNNFKSPLHVLMSVWGGAGYLQQFMDNPQSVRTLTDGDITFEEYSAALGSHGGRRYVTPWRAAAVNNARPRPNGSSAPANPSLRTEYRPPGSVSRTNPMTGAGYGASPSPSPSPAPRSSSGGGSTTGWSRTESTTNPLVDRRPGPLPQRGGDHRNCAVCDMIRARNGTMFPHELVRK